MELPDAGRGGSCASAYATDSTFLGYIAKIRTQQQQKQAWYIQELKNKRGSEERYKVKEKELSHSDAFRPC